MNALFAFIAGLVFGIGLLLSGMTDPAKVTAFLDVAGAWDPSLVFVMGGAVLVAFFAFVFAQRRAVTAFGQALHLPTRRDIDWRLAFLAGLLLAPFVMASAAPRIDAGIVTLVVAGLLVGIGTSYASGCTSGHGVCGVSRLSPRSLVATLAFIGTGIATVFVVRHLL